LIGSSPATRSSTAGSVRSPVRATGSRRYPEVLEHYWQQLGLTFDPVKSAEAANTITRITGGNFRLIEPIMSQVGRLLSINDLHTITPEIIEAARLTLVVGT